MHANGKSTLASVSKWNSGKVSFSTVGVAQWVRHWSGDHRVVQAEGSSPDGDTYQTFFSNDFYFRFVRPNRLQ